MTYSDRETHGSRLRSVAHRPEDAPDPFEAAVKQVQGARYSMHKAVDHMVDAQIEVVNCAREVDRAEGDQEAARSHLRDTIDYFDEVSGTLMRFINAVRRDDGDGEDQAPRR